MKNKIVFAVLVVMILATGAALFIHLTPAGVGLVSDSVNYINGARSIASGHGYYRASGDGTLKPITNFSPLYSILLSVPIRFGMDGIRAAWYLSLLFVILNLFMVILLVREASDSNAGGIAAGVVFLISAPFFQFQMNAMSEPVFFFCTLGAFYFFCTAAKENRWLQWLLCGIFCGLAFLTRYAGIVSLCAVVLAALLLFPGWKQRFRSVLLLLGGSLPLIAVWLLRNIRVSGSAANRTVMAHWLPKTDLEHGALIFWRWVWPERYEKVSSPLWWMSAALAVALAAALLGMIVLCILRNKRKNHDLPLFLKMIWVYLLYILGYLAMVILTISFFDASVNIEERILYPAFMAFMLLILTFIGWALISHRWVPQLISGVLMAFFLFTFSWSITSMTLHVQSEGYGWAWQGWNTSPAMNIIRKLPEQVTLYSNQPEAVSLWTGRGAYALLDPVDPSTNEKRPGYDDTLKTIQAQVRDGKAVLVFFDIGKWVDSNGGGSWVTDLCSGLPFIYQDQSEWVVGISDFTPGEK